MPVLLLCVLLLLPLSAKAQSLAIDGGTGQKVDVYAVELGSPSLHTWTVGKDWSLDVELVGRVAYWLGEEVPREPNTELWDFSVTPIFRLQPAVAWRYATPYFEAGVGVHLLSEESLSGRKFGMAFQFGEVIGAGVMFGSRRQYQLGIRGQHVSNAYLDEDNDGLTWASVILGYRFSR